MAVAEAVSTLGAFKTYSSENATLATALSEVLNELEEQNISLNQTRFVLTFDDSNNKYAFVAICKMH
jgi:hypothetical protein